MQPPLTLCGHLLRSVLARFVGTLTDPGHIKMVQEIYNWDRQHKVVRSGPDAGASGRQRYPKGSAVWELVKLTEAHPGYRAYRSLRSERPGWVKAPRLLSASAERPRLYGVDLGLGRIVALYYRSSTSFRIH